MNSSTPAPEALCGQLAETCLLQCYLIEAIDRQQLESCVQRRSGLKRLADRALETLHQHTAHLSSLLASHPAGHDELKNSSARFGARFLVFVGKERARELSAMLRDDYALLRLTVANYTRLQATALARHDLAVATLARTHLRALGALGRDLIRQIRQITPRKTGQVRLPLKQMLSAGNTSGAPFSWPDGTAAA